jgi:hypothetical protein
MPGAEPAGRPGRQAETEAEFAARLSRLVAETEGREWVPPEPEPEPRPEPLPEAQFQEKLGRIVAESEGREPEPKAGPEPEAEGQAAVYAEIHEDLQYISRAIGELSARMDAEDARRAEARQEWLARPSSGRQAQAQAETALEPSWQPGTAGDRSLPEADYEAEAEI